MLSNNNSGMLAGVCSRIAGLLGWNVWAIRAVLLILLIAQPLWTALGYVAAALLLAGLVRGGQVFDGQAFSSKSSHSHVTAGKLLSPELAIRKQRIDDLEQRFREWERSLKKPD